MDNTNYPPGKTPPPLFVVCMQCMRNFHGLFSGLLLLKHTRGGTLLEETLRRANVYRHVYTQF